jgi:hypothetical protein
MKFGTGLVYIKSYWENLGLVCISPKQSLLSGAHTELYQFYQKWLTEQKVVTS